MWRATLFTITIQGLCAIPSLADDYLVRVDTTTFRKPIQSDAGAEETILRTIETTARLGSEFHSTVRVGTDSMLIRGILRPLDGDKFRVRVRYVYSNTNGTTSVFTSNIHVTLDEPFVLTDLGGANGEAQIVLILAEYDSAPVSQQ